MILFKGKQSISVFWLFFYIVSKNWLNFFKVAIRFHPGARFSNVPVFFLSAESCLMFSRFAFKTKVEIILKTIK